MKSLCAKGITYPLSAGILQGLLPLIMTQYGKKAHRIVCSRYEYSSYLRSPTVYISGRNKNDMKGGSLPSGDRKLDVNKPFSKRPALILTNINTSCGKRFVRLNLAGQRQRHT